MTTTIHDITDLRQEIEQLIFRAKFYNEPITSESLESLLRDSPECEDHDDCVTSDAYQELENTIDELIIAGDELNKTLKIVDKELDHGDYPENQNHYQLHLKCKAVIEAWKEAKP